MREAAMRLWGEGLLEPHPKGGLRPVQATDARLRALLGLNEQLALAVVFATGDCVLPSLEEQAPPERRARAIFRALALRSGNLALVEVVERLSDRLALFRACEPAVIPDAPSDHALLERALLDRSGLRKNLRRYHRRRLAKSSELVWAATAMSGPGGAG